MILYISLDFVLQKAHSKLWFQVLFQCAGCQRLKQVVVVVLGVVLINSGTELGIWRIPGTMWREKECTTAAEELLSSIQLAHHWAKQMALNRLGKIFNIPLQRLLNVDTTLF